MGYGDGDVDWRVVLMKGWSRRRSYIILARNLRRVELLMVRTTTLGMDKTSRDTTNQKVVIDIKVHNLINL